MNEHQVGYLFGRKCEGRAASATDIRLVELKEIAKKHGLSYTGTKDILCERIRNYLTIQTKKSLTKQPQQNRSSPKIIKKKLFKAHEFRQPELKEYGVKIYEEQQPKLIKQEKISKKQKINKKDIIVFDFDCTLTYAHTYYFFTDINQFTEYDNGIWTQGYDKKTLQELSKSLDDKFLENDIDNFDPNTLSRKDKDIFIDVIYGGQKRLNDLRIFLNNLSEYATLYIASNQYYYSIVGSLMIGGLDEFFLDSIEKMEYGDSKIYRINARESSYNENDKYGFIDQLHDKHPNAIIHYIDDDSKDNKEFIELNSGINPDYYIYYGENIGLLPNETGLNEKMMEFIDKSVKIHNNGTITTTTSKKTLDSSILNPRQLKALSGATLFAHYPNIDGRNILLLGDEHTDQLLCNPTVKDVYEIHKWLYDLVKAAPGCVDIMLEIPYLKERQSIKHDKYAGPVKNLRNKLYQSPLDAIIHQFFECYSKQKPENCISDKLRLHYIDLRQMDAVYDIIHYLSITHSFSKNLLLKYKPNEKLIYEYIMGYDKSNNAKQVYHSFFADIFKLHNRSLDINKLDDFTNTFWIIIDKEFKKLDMSNEDKTKFYRAIFNTYVKLGSLFGLAGAKIYMDIYALLRMFIKFDTKKKRSSCPNIMKNIIIDAGVHHTLLYIEFFKLYFNQDPDQETFVWNENLLGGSADKCIIFKEPFDFFKNNTNDELTECFANKDELSEIRTNVLHDQNYFYKIVDNASNDLYFSKLLNDTDLIPKTEFKNCMFNGKKSVLIKMEKYDGNLFNYIDTNPTNAELTNALKQIVKKSLILNKKYNVRHGDFHPGNIIYKINKNGTIDWRFIDFEVSVQYNKNGDLIRDIPSALSDIDYHYFYKYNPLFDLILLESDLIPPIILKAGQGEPLEEYRKHVVSTLDESAKEMYQEIDDIKKNYKPIILTI